MFPGQVWQPAVVIVILNNAAVGIVTSLFLKNLNSILKTFASALELVFIAILSWVSVVVVNELYMGSKSQKEKLSTSIPEMFAPLTQSPPLVHVLMHNIFIKLALLLMFYSDSCSDYLHLVLCVQ